MTLRLIGISGKMGTGKSTLTRMMSKHIENMHIMKFATPLYDIQDSIYSKLNLELQGEKDRELLVAIGNWARSKDSDIFAKTALASAEDILKFSKATVVFDDVRFENEADMIVAMGGLLIRIEGDQRGPNLDETLMKSRTETALDNYEFEHRISNKTDKIDLIHQFMSIYKK